MYPRLGKMASGNMEIVLQGGVAYHDFPEVAEAWVKRLSLRVVHKVDGPGERIWDCRFGHARFWLAHDDWFPEISLEPQDDDAGTLVAEMFDGLMKDTESNRDGGRLRR